MTFQEIINLSPSMGYYNLKDKAINYIASKSFECFDKADNVRNSVKTKEEFLNYQEEVKKNFKKVIGKIPYDKSYELKPEITGVINCDGFKIEKVIFKSREGVYVSCNLYLPKDINGKIPAILLQLGHAANGKMSADYQKVARVLVKSGFAVLSMDPTGQGERLNYIENNKSVVDGAVKDHQRFGNQCFLTGNYAFKYFLCDAMRAIDYLETREEIDSEKIGATGTSGGGTMTSVLMAYDNRIKAAAPSCFLTSRREYYYSGSPQDAEQILVDGTKLGIDHYELVTCFCPRPLLMLTVDSDFFPLEGSHKLYKKEKEFYGLMGCEENIRITTDKSEHRYTINNASKAAEFFKEFFYNEKTIVEPCDYGALDEEKLWCTKSGNITTDYCDSKTIFDESLEFLKNKKEKTIEEKKAFFEEKIFNNREEMDFYLKEFQTPEADGFKIQRFMWYSQPNMPCYGVKLTLIEDTDKSLPVKLCLFENGTDEIVKRIEEIRKICLEGYSAFVVDLSTMGKCEPYSSNINKDIKEDVGMLTKLNSDMMFVGDSLCALKVYDLIRTIKMIREEMGILNVSIYSVGRATILARILEFSDFKVEAKFKDEISVNDIVADKYYEIYNISGFIIPKMAEYLK